MNSITRRCKASAMVLGGWLFAGVAWLTFGSPDRAAADVLVRFVNGRELVVRTHWFTGSQVCFTQGRGTIGVPRELVASIAALDAQRGIGAAREAVNAQPLVAPGPIR